MPDKPLKAYVVVMVDYFTKAAEFSPVQCVVSLVLMQRILRAARQKTVFCLLSAAVGVIVQLHSCFCLSVSETDKLFWRVP
jgi:hypothetical protein